MTTTIHWDDAFPMLRLEGKGARTAFITNHGFGYYITDWLQPVGEIGYIYENIDNSRNAHVLSLTGGFTADLTDYATLIVGLTKDIVSEDTEDTFVITTALTLIF